VDLFEGSANEIQNCNFKNAVQQSETLPGLTNRDFHSCVS
jgi:hypothetical protein